MNKTDKPRRVSKVTAQLLGYRTPADVPFLIRGPHGTPVHVRPATYTIKGSGKVRVV